MAGQLHGHGGSGHSEEIHSRGSPQAETIAMLRRSTVADLWPWRPTIEAMEVDRLWAMAFFLKKLLLLLC